MKTKEEILEHLERVGHQKDDAMKILGYLLGAQIVEKGEVVHFHTGDGTFEDFFKWVHEEPKKNVFFDIATNLDYLLSYVTPGEADGIREKTNKNIELLLENKEYLQDCLDHKGEAEAFLNDIAEVMNGLNDTLSKIFSTR